jgi:RNA polymerase sigma-70 factor, ECF subfamily
LDDEAKRAQFGQTVLIHLDAAYNLGRWLTRDEAGAQDAVQEACLRAFRFFDRLQGPSPKAWFMTIVRNACLDWIKENRLRHHDEEFDEEVHFASGSEAPDDVIARAADARWLRACIERLPRDYREVIVLRELEELSYKEIGAIVGVPIGTVMSRLARARDLLQQRMIGAQTRISS